MARHAVIGAALVLLLVGCTRPLGSELFVHGARLTRAHGIVVLGNRPPRLPTGQVAPETDARVRRGVELFERRLAPLLVLVGSAQEVEVMRAHAIALGVPEPSIVVDGTSRDTADNARTAIAAICRGRRTCHPRVLVVSSAYHLRRARELMRCAGAADVQVAASALPEAPGRQASLAAYEYGVRLAYIFRDACASARSANH